MTDTEADGTEREWESVEKTSFHDEHWHYGEEAGDGWASITASHSGTIGGFYDEKWTVEFYDGKEPCQRERADTREEMLLTVGRFMGRHERSLNSDSDPDGGDRI